MDGILHGADASILKSEDDVANIVTGDSPITKEEVQTAGRMLNDGKSPSVDNIPAEILTRRGPCVIDTLTVVCQRIWTSGQWNKDRTKSLIIPLPKKGQHDFVRITER